MTLFRKVFHNQTQQVGDGALPAEESLRKALTDAPDASGPYLLDPLMHAVEAGEAEYPDAPDEQEHLTLEDEVRHTGHAANEADKMSEPDATRLQAVALEDSGTLDMQRQVKSGPAFEGRVDAQDEVDALLERTMERQSAASEQAGESVTEDDTVRPGADQVPELVDDLEFCILNDQVQEGERDRSAGEPQEAYPPQPAKNPEGTAVGGSAQASPPEADPEKVDARAFARQQLQAMGAAASHPSDPSLSLTAKTEGDAIPKPVTSPADLSDGTDIEGVPAPAVGRAGRRAGRVKTRLLGFNRAGDAGTDPFGDVAASTATPQRETFPVGWLVIVEGPGRGHAFSIFAGASMIGRGEDQMIRLDFGDNSISRHNHAAIAYDDETNKFFIGHGGKSNIIRRNARPVLSTEELHHADLLRIGETTLRFVALCGSDFQWADVGDGDAAPL